MAKLRFALLAFGLAACAATTPPVATETAATADRHGERCAKHADCPGGSCRAGTCSWVAPDEGNRELCVTETVPCLTGGPGCKNVKLCANGWASGFASQR